MHRGNAGIINKIKALKIVQDGLINFWATSCTTCVAEMPMLSATYEKFRGRGYEIIAVAMKYDPPGYGG